MNTDEQPPAVADFSVELRVRWSDCDPAGVLFYGHYFAYFEEALGQFIRARGLTWNQFMHEHGLFFPRVEAQVRYLAPAAYDDDVRVTVRVLDVGRKILTIGYTMTRCRDARTIAEGQVKFAVIKPEPGSTDEPRAIELPPVVVQAFGAGRNAAGRGE